MAQKRGDTGKVRKNPRGPSKITQNSKTVGNPNSEPASRLRGEATKRRMKRNTSAARTATRKMAAATAAKSAARKAAVGTAMRAAGPVGAAVGAAKMALDYDKRQRGGKRPAGAPKGTGGQMKRGRKG
jgi:hypothetical protein